MKMSRATCGSRVSAFAAILLLLVVSTPISLVNPGAVLADSWVVTSLADDGSPGTLRYAIHYSSEGDTISFSPGLSGTIHLDPGAGALYIDHPLTIEGPGAGTIRIDGGEETQVLIIGVGDIIPVDAIIDLLDSIGDISGLESIAGLLQVEPSQPIEFEPAVVIEGLTLSNGAALHEPEEWDELFAAVGGNVLVLGSSAAIRDCIIETGSAIGGGGGIAAAASLLSLERCTVRQNTAGGLSYDVGLSGGGGGLLTAVAYVHAEDCVFEQNVAQSEDSGIGIGGGLVSLVSLWDFDACVISENVAEDGDGPPGFGGGIVALLSLCNLEGCDIVDNVAGDGDSGGVGGGVVAAYNLLFNVQQCTVSGNSAGPNDNGIGGGMLLGPSLLGGGNVVRDCLIAGNSAGSEGREMAAGGGIAFADILYSIGIPDVFPSLTFPEPEPGQPDVLSLHLVNCTLSGNSAGAAQYSTGGGLWAGSESPVGLSFCTVTGNSAGWGGGLSTDPFAIYGEEPGQLPYGILLLKNSIVAGNTALADARGGDEPSPPMPVAGDDIWGPIVSLYGNIIGDAHGWGTLQEGEPAVVLPDEDCDDIVGVDARLDPLANNGGPTMTHALRPDSPALDAACDGLAISDYIIDFDDIVIVLGDSGLESGDLTEPGFIEGAPVESDQRGESRPIDGDADGEAVCDSGAFEARPDIVMQGGAGGVLAPATAEGNCSTVAVTVRNEGDAPLLLDSIEFEGSNAGDFSLGSNVTGTVLQPGQSIRIPVRFCPKADGRRVARMLVYSTDPDEPVVEVGLTGRARQERAVSPAEMNTSYLLIDPVQVLPGQQITVSANICNNGEERGSHTATLSVNGVAEQSQSIAVSGGSCQTVVFAVSRAVPGTYQVSVDGMQGQFSVLAPRTVQASVPSQQDTGLGTVGLIAVIGVGLALIGALVVLFRQT